MRSGAKHLPIEVEVFRALFSISEIPVCIRKPRRVKHLLAAARYREGLTLERAGDVRPANYIARLAESLCMLGNSHHAQQRRNGEPVIVYFVRSLRNCSIGHFQKIF